MQVLASARRSGSSRWIRCVCLAAAALGATSCATAAGGGRQTRLLVTSEPPGVTLYVNGANMGPTPSRIDVTPGESSMALQLVCDGYQDAEVTVTRRMHGRLETSLPIEGEPIDVADHIRMQSIFWSAARR